jgi:WD40 repeat protein
MNPLIRRAVWPLAVCALLAMSAPRARPDEGIDKPVLKDRLGDPLPADALARLGTHRFRQAESTAEVAFHPDGRLIAAIDGRGRVGLWDAATGKQVAGPAIDYGEATFAFSPDGKKLATLEDRGVRLWDLRGKDSFLLPRGDGLDARTLAFSPCGRYIAEGGRALFLYHVKARKAIFQLKGHRLLVTTVAFSPDGSLLASAGDSHPTADTPILLWETESGRLLAKLKGHTNTIYDLAFSPDGKTLASASNDKTLRFWDVAKRRQTRKITHRAVALAFSPDGKLLATGEYLKQGGITLWDPATGERLRRFARGQWIGDLAFSPDGKRLLSCGYHGSHALRLWEVATGKELLALDGHRHAVLSLAFSPDGKKLATRGGDNTACLWDVATGRMTDHFLFEISDRGLIGTPWFRDDSRTVAFSPDGKTLACLGGPFGPEVVVQLWDVPGRRLREPVPCGGGRGTVNALAFSPDGSALAVASGWGTQLLSLPSGKRLALLDAEPGVEHRFLDDLDVAFSPDGNTLATGSADTTALLWDVRKYRPKPLPRPDRDDLPKLWDRLRDDDPARAYPALWRLAAAGDDAVALLCKHLRPVPTPDPKRIQALLKDLDSETFKVRDKARGELVAMGEPAGPALRRLLEGKPPLEVRRLAEQALEAIRAVADHGLSLRELRAVSVLGQIGTPKARALLKELAKGADEATLTRRARVALRLTGAGRERR